MIAAAKKSVFGVALSYFQANRIVNHLANAGFSRDTISMLFAGRAASGGASAAGSKSRTQTLATDVENHSSPRFKAFKAGGSSTGGEPGVAAVAPAGLKAGAGPDGAVTDDPVLICLRADAWREAEAARKIFQAMGATNVSLGGEKAVRLLAGTFQQSDAAPQFQCRELSAIK